MMKLFILASFILSFTITFSSYADSKGRVLEGFNWYNEKPIREKQEDTEKTKEKSDQNTKDLSESDLPEYERNIRSLQDRHEKAHRKALDQPTFDNLLEELRLEKEMMDKSKSYGERRVAVVMFDSKFSNMKEHHNVLHRSVQDQVDSQDTQKKLTQLSKDWGLILQVQDECQHCHAFAPIVLEFAKDYGFQLLAASKTGSDFENIEGVKDHGQMLSLNPARETPMLYLVKGDGSEVIPISRGINSDDQIILNIKSIDKHIRRLFDV